MQKRKYVVECTILIIFITICCFLSTKENVIQNTITTRKDDSTIPQQIAIPSLAKENLTVSHPAPIAKLKIKQIKLESNLYDIGTKENEVDKNVTILEESVFPDNNSSILFIAAHSGNGRTAYFKNLDKLTLKDTAEIIYKNTNYIYEIVNIYERKKDGYIELNKVSNHQLVLTTCSQKSKNKQLIINAKLIQKKDIK